MPKLNYLVITVKVSPEVKKRLEKAKIHHRQSYNEVIEKLLDYYDSKEK